MPFDLSVFNNTIQTKLDDTSEVKDILILSKTVGVQNQVELLDSTIKTIENSLINKAEVNALASKADLVNGKVPNAQLGISASLSSLLDSKATLVNGKIPSSLLPSVAITEYLGVATSEAELLAFTGANKGDWASRTDTNSTWIVIGDDASQISSWTELAANPNQALDSLSDIDITNVINGHLLMFNSQSNSWVNLSLDDAGISPSNHNHEGTYVPLTVYPTVVEYTVTANSSSSLTIVDDNGSSILIGNPGQTVKITNPFTSSPLGVSSTTPSVTITSFSEGISNNQSTDNTLNINVNDLLLNSFFIYSVAYPSLSIQFNKGSGFANLIHSHDYSLSSHNHHLTYARLDANNSYSGNQVILTNNNADALTVSNTGSGNAVVINGNTQLNGGVEITGNIIPSSDSVYNLGSETNKFHSLYVSGNTIYIQDKALTIEDDVIKVLRPTKFDGPTGDFNGSSDMGGNYVESENDFSLITQQVNQGFSITLTKESSEITSINIKAYRDSTLALDKSFSITEFSQQFDLTSFVRGGVETLEESDILSKLEDVGVNGDDQYTYFKSPDNPSLNLNFKTTNANLEKKSRFYKLTAKKNGSTSSADLFVDSFEKNLLSSVSRTVDLNTGDITFSFS